MIDHVTPTKKERRTGSAPPGFERIATLAVRIGFSASTIHSWVATLGFPAPTKLGARVSIYNTKAVDAWMAERGLLPAQGASA